jgi:F-type H+-transporting ATPase subunit epsilon
VAAGDKSFHVSVVTPEGSVLEADAVSAVFPAFDGEVGILPNHAPFMTLLGSGTLTIRRAGSISRFAVKGGFLQVVDNRVRVVAEHVKGESHAS